MTTFQSRGLPCDSKNSYVDDVVARRVGRRASTRADVPLWVYRCQFCSAWHLTKQDNGPENNVFSEQSHYDSIIAIPGSGTYWERLNDLSHEDASEVLQALLAGLKAERKELPLDQDTIISDMITDVGIRLHRTNRIVKRKQFYGAVKTILGQESLDQLKAEIARVLDAETIHSNCQSQARYADERAARIEGRHAGNDQRSDLWVYPCGYCNGWHLTVRRRARHWHVSNDLSLIDDCADLLGDDYFWHRLVDMPRDDLEYYLRSATRRMVNANRRPEPSEQVRLGRLIRRLRDEIDLIYNKLRSDMPSIRILAPIFGEEALIPVLQLVREMEAMSRENFKLRATRK